MAIHSPFSVLLLVCATLSSNMKRMRKAGVSEAASFLLGSGNLIKGLMPAALVKASKGFEFICLENSDH